MNKIMKKFLFAFAFLAISIGSLAQGGDPVKAKEILKKSSTKFRTYKSVSGEVKGYRPKSQGNRNSNRHL
jgi:outer membrane lipoprotein-sorting protein